MGVITNCRHNHIRQDKAVTIYFDDLTGVIVNNCNFHRYLFKNCMFYEAMCLLNSGFSLTCELENRVILLLIRMLVQGIFI
jgi:hypothetical protein